MEENYFDYKSLKDLVYEYLRKNIEDGVLKPGDPIDEKIIMQKLNVSRTPIREALLMLNGDGFITILPRRRVIVNETSLKDIEEIFQILGPLEGEAAIGAIEKMSDEDIKELEVMTKKMKIALEQGDFDKYYEFNWKIHEFFLELNDNKTLNRIVRLLKQRYYSSPQILKKQDILNKRIPPMDAQAMEFHLKMVELCKKRDKRGLRRMLRDNHWCYKKRKDILKTTFNNNGD
jgi:DNA-binding GntR family transcriptional regulator